MMNKSIIDHVDLSIELAKREVSKLPSEVLNIKGMSTPKVRHLLNNLCELFTSYLEVGTWMGSTLVSAAWGNKLETFGIDNFSEIHDGRVQDEVRNQLLNNLKLTQYNPPHFIEGSCWDFNLIDSQIKPGWIDIYLYDGAHDELSQHDGITKFDKYLAKTCLILIDDWELSSEVGLGTLNGFRELPHKIIHSWTVTKAEGFHNGLYIALVEKP